MSHQKLQQTRTRSVLPTSSWSCGWPSDEWACPSGPDPNGQCGGPSECFPIKKEDRWYCGRSANQGGLCSSGPYPDGTCSKPMPLCQPLRNFKAMQATVTLWTSGMTLGIILLLLPASIGPTVISPGDLSVPHSPLSQSCNACHSALRTETVSGLIQSMLGGEGLESSNQCLHCHQVGKYPLQAHGNSALALSFSKQGQIQTSPPPQTPLAHTLAAYLPAIPQNKDTKWPCMTCHSEHQGKAINLTFMDDNRCQSCHTRKFTSFNQGHPPMTEEYPFSRRTPIAFDHNSHLNKHFLGKEKKWAPATCQHCHSLDSAGSTMTTGDFRTTCANCHIAQIEGQVRAGVKGIPIFQLPGLDTAVLGEHNISIGEWPADEFVEGGLNPFMRLLLSGDPNLVVALKGISDLEDFTDLSDASEKELRAIGEIIWAIKSFFFDLMTEGQNGMLVRLEKSMGKEMPSEKLAALSGQLPVEVIQNAQQIWFPRLMTEVPQFRNGQKVQPPPIPEMNEIMTRDPLREDLVEKGGWYRQDADFAIYYRPEGHADPFIRTWLEIMGRQNRTQPSHGNEEVFGILSDPEGPGVCMKCHSIDRQGDNSFKIHWRTTGIREREKAFTKFSHGPHLSFQEEKDCQGCHILEPDGDVMGSYKYNDPFSFSSSFKPIEKPLCSSCHTSGVAGVTCVTCHNYHVGEVGPGELNQSQLMKIKKRKI